MFVTICELLFVNGLIGVLSDCELEYTFPSTTKQQLVYVIASSNNNYWLLDSYPLMISKLL